MDFEQDDDSGTFTLRIKSRSGKIIHKVKFDLSFKFWCRNMTWQDFILWCHLLFDRDRRYLA